MRAGSGALFNEGGDSHASSTQLAAEVWERSWNHELRREGVQAQGPSQVRGVQRTSFLVTAPLVEVASGLTFQEWDPSADIDASQAAVAMIVNSSELRAADLDLREVIPLQPGLHARPRVEAGVRVARL